MSSRFLTGPYRWLFPLGTLLGALGMLPWIGLSAGVSAYPGAWHPDVMVGGFLFSFAAGFLLTAVPRISGTSLPGRGEILSVAAASAGMVTAAALSLHVAFRALLLVDISCLAVFCARRAAARVTPSAFTFLFLLWGVGLGLAGDLLLLLGQAVSLPAPATLFARGLLYHGMMLCLVLGIGTRMIPAFFGHAAAGCHTRQSAEGESAELRRGIFFLTMFTGAFAIEAFGAPGFGRALRALGVSVVAFRVWQIHRLPRVRSRLTLWLWVSAWFLTVGLWVPALLPAFAIHASHLALVGGLSLMTLLFASRFTLAHGGYDLGEELRSAVLRWTGLLIVLAALTRACAPVTPGAYLSHLAYAAGAWILALGIWAVAFVPRLIGGGRRSLGQS